MISISRVGATVCSCHVCQRRRRLESKLEVTRGVLAGNRPFVLGLDGPLYRDDRDDLDDMVAGLEEAIDTLAGFDHRALKRRRGPRRTISRFMAR